VTPYYDQDGIIIYHGDCREILPTLKGDSIDFIFTDPPYGLGVNQNDLQAVINRRVLRSDTSIPRPITNDGDEAHELVRLLFAEAKRLLIPGACCCCCAGGGGPQPVFAKWSLWLDELLGFKQMVVWDKGPMGLGWHYRRSYEVVLVGQKQGAACRGFDDTETIENIIRHIPRIHPGLQSSHDHPTSKPVALINWFMRLHTAPGHLVLDPFMGGGPTMLAAASNGCRAIGIEIEERYCELTARRLSQGVFDFEALLP